MRLVWIVTALLIIAASAFAQPSGQYLRMQGYPQHGYIEIPHDVLLDTPAMTVEAWVSVRDAHGTACSSIAGKGYQTGWWLGLCGTTMRSYFNGIGSQRDGGVIPDTPTTIWIHIAAVTDGTTRKHYINGNLVSQGVESPRSVSTLPLRIGSDPNYDFMPEGGIDDFADLEGGADAGTDPPDDVCALHSGSERRRGTIPGTGGLVPVRRQRL